MYTYAGSYGVGAVGLLADFTQKFPEHIAEISLGGTLFLPCYINSVPPTLNMFIDNCLDVASVVRVRHDHRDPTNSRLHEHYPHANKLVADPRRV